MKLPFIFKDPFELLAFYDDDIRLGRARLYPWQVECLKQFARRRSSIEDIIKLALVANNGSGKSKYILAPCAVWLAVNFAESLTIVTSSSAEQLDKQTERYIDMLADKMDTMHKGEFGGVRMWDNVKRAKRFLPHKSFIDLFATDEPKRAEGRHPLVIDGEFAIIVDEGKSVADDIYGAMMRCKGYTRRLDASSSGNTSGYFYDSVTKPELGWWTKTVTVFDCPHIAKAEIADNIARYGLWHPLVRSSLFSEFTSAEGKVVITKEAIDNAANVWKVAENHALNTGMPNPLILHFGEHSGLDLSAGGDEIVLSIWDGTVQRAQETAVFRNTVLGTQEIIHWIQKHRLDATKIWADDGGIGRGIIDNLHAAGYLVNRVLNQWRAMDKTRYANHGTESWFSFKRFVEEAQLKLLPDKKLESQLINRYYKIRQTTNQIILESKEEARANGHPSPDRADAAVLAWTNFPFPLNLEALLNKNKTALEKDEVVNEQRLMELYVIARRSLLGVPTRFDTTGVSGVDNKRGDISTLRQEHLIASTLRGDGREEKPIDAIRRSLRRRSIFGGDN